VQVVPDVSQDHSLFIGRVKHSRIFLDWLTVMKKSPQHHILKDSSLHVISLFDVQRTVQHRDIFL